MKQSYIKYLLSLLIFGSNGVVASYIHLSSYYIVLLRVSIGAALLLGIFFLTGHRFSIAQHRRDYLIAGLSAVAYTLMVLANKLSKEVKGVENATWQLFCAAVVVAVFVGCKQGFAMQIAPPDWFPILLLGIGGAVFGECYRGKGARPAE